MRLKDYLNLHLEMTKREVKARYKNAFLGFLWILLNPILQMLIIGFIFKVFIKVPISNYYLFLFSGLLPWNFFSYSLTKTTPSIVYERELIQKAKFAHESIPLSIVFSNFFHFLISLLLLIIFLLFTKNTSLSNSFYAVSHLFISIFWILSFTSGFSLLTSALNVKYRDINFFIQALVIIWFYATPVMYSLEILPQKLQLLFQFNPIAYPFEKLRSSLIGTDPPSLQLFFTNFSISIIIILLGILIFRKESKNFSDWL